MTNLQGDVLHIVNASGTPVVSYSYDPYGKPTVSPTTTNVSLAEINPLRYRGYVYDSETGLYYLQSRYYDPTIGRWINADGFISTGQSMAGYNMFAYCGNNPVNRKDFTGQSWTIAVLITVCAVLLSACGNNEPIVVPETGPYSSADDAARGFAQEVYAASSYIRHEYAATIYAETNDGVTTYNYTKPYSGNPHSVAIGYNNIPTGATVVAYIHTHPNSNDFSITDKKAAGKLHQNLYLVNPDHQLQVYSPFEEKTYILGYISPSMLTDDQKSALVNEFKISWDAHLGSCDFQCEKKLWPTP